MLRSQKELVVMMSATQSECRMLHLIKDHSEHGQFALVKCNEFGDIRIAFLALTRQ